MCIPVQVCVELQEHPDTVSQSLVLFSQWVVPEQNETSEQLHAHHPATVQQLTHTLHRLRAQITDLQTEATQGYST